MSLRLQSRMDHYDEGKMVNLILNASNAKEAPGFNGHVIKQVNQPIKS